MSRAEALLVTPVMPADRGNGLAMRAGLLLEGLARACSVRVLVVPVFGEPGPPTELAGRLAARIDVLPVGQGPEPVPDMVERLGSPAGRARAQELHPLPRLCRTATPARAQAVAEAARGVDLVWSMRLYLAPFLDALLDQARRPAIALDVDDVESVTWRDLGEPREAEAFERIERHYLPRVDRVLACAQGDADWLADRYRVPSPSVVPNAVHPPSETGSAGVRHDLLFVGNLSYAPNADGARWLCSEVLPGLGRATLALVGSRPGPALLALAEDERITVAGDVPEVGPWYAGAAVAVVPVRCGGGTRIKLIEALAHRRPVVATRAGAAGLAADGEAPGVLVADTADDFASACRRLLEDEALAERLAEEGEAYVRANAAVGVVAPRVEAIARAMVER